MSEFEIEGSKEDGESRPPHPTIVGAEKDKSCEMDCWILTIYVMAIFVILLCNEHRSGSHSRFLSNRVHEKVEFIPSRFSKENFKAKLGSIKTLFPKQTPYFWKLIGSVSEDVIVSKNPKRPAVILLAGGPDAHQTLDNLASELSTSYSHLEGNSSVIEIDGTRYKNEEPHNAKRLIDEKLKCGFNTGRQVAIIHHFESIPAEASMIFHSYCENDNAPFKRVVIIFTVHIKENLNSQESIKINQKKVEQHLESKWKDAVDKDHIEAMFSRVATAVAFVTPE